MIKIHNDRRDDDVNNDKGNVASNDVRPRDEVDSG